MSAATLSIGDELLLGQTSDTNSWLGPLLKSFGSELVNESGKITVNSDGTRAALEYMKKLTQFMPPEIYSWDDAGNNLHIISGRGACIQNPPSAWAAAKKTQPANAAQMWHHDTPRGPNGRYRRGTCSRCNPRWSCASRSNAPSNSRGGGRP